MSCPCLGDGSFLLIAIIVNASYASQLEQLTSSETNSFETL